MRTEKYKLIEIYQINLKKKGLGTVTVNLVTGFFSRYLLFGLWARASYFITNIFFSNKMYSVVRRIYKNLGRGLR